MPPIVEITHTYDAASNGLTRYNETATLAWNHRDEEFDYDGLNRVVEGRRGERDGQTFTHSNLKRSQEWKLDILGNWETLSEWDGGYSAVDTRTHTHANEIDTRQAGGENLSFTYDEAGNIRTQQIPRPGGGTVAITYTHDAWNRLVKLRYANAERAEYRYNGLNWRVLKRSDTSMPPDGTLNQQRVMYYSASWQLLEERIDDD